MIRSARAALILAIALTAPRGLASNPTPDPAPEVSKKAALTAALNAFDQGVAAIHDDALRAERLFGEAADGFERLIASGMHNAGLEYNLANTYFRLGKLGDAILHYRRAQRFAPSDRQINDNLNYARQRVEPAIPASGQRQLLDRLMFWNRHLSTASRFRFAAIAGIVGWALLVLRLRWRSGGLTALALMGIVVGLANAASIAWEFHDAGRHRPAVVTQAGQTLRLGRGEGADPAMAQKLGAGIELRILSERGGWYEVLLPNDLRGWLPAEAVTPV